jgi:hypothetical protein
MRTFVLIAVVIFGVIAGISLAVRTNNQKSSLQESADQLSRAEQQLAAGNLNAANSLLIQLDIGPKDVNRFYTLPSVKRSYGELVTRRTAMQERLSARVNAIRQVMDSVINLIRAGEVEQAQKSVKTALMEISDKDPALLALARYVDRLKGQDFKQAGEAIAKLKASLPEELNTSEIGSLLSEFVNNEKKANRDSQSSIATQVKSLVRLSGARELAKFTPTLKGRAMVWDFTKKDIDQAYELLPEDLRGSARDGVITMFIIISRRHVLVGHYSVSGQPGYKEEMKIGVVYWPDKVSPGTAVVTDDPRSMRPVQYVPEYGSVQIKEWIERLPKP